MIAGLAIGLVTSAYPPPRADLERVVELTRSFREQPTPELARTRAARGGVRAISPNERLQYRLHPWTSFVIVPLFALANAGIHVNGGLLCRRGRLADHARDRAAATSSASRSAIMLGAWLGTRPADRASSAR